MKSEILAALRGTQDYVSGQELCEKLKVSRTAVWKKIKELQSEGYEIEAVPNRGYRIVGAPDTITAEEVESRLTTDWAGRPVRYFEEITSTNQYAKRLGEEGQRKERWLWQIGRPVERGVPAAPGVRRKGRRLP